MVRLGVNIDHVATIRQARRGREPDPIAAATLATLGGADGITIHLREDRRHIQDRDVRLLRETVTTRLNLEMATVEEILQLAVALKPDEVTLVPEKRAELTTEGGLDILTHESVVRSAIDRLQAATIPVSLFLDPDELQIAAAHRYGANAIEIQTATYSEAKNELYALKELEKLRSATRYALELGLRVHMGHGLNYWNVQPIVQIPGVEELNIGHSIVSRAVLVGMEQAVRDMKQVINSAIPNRPRSA
jgi:pyridoxine 5-phosphate synthase